MLLGNFRCCLLLVVAVVVDVEGVSQRFLLYVLVPLYELGYRYRLLIL